MHNLFWRVVNATSEFTFKKALELVVQHGGRGAGRWFLDLGEKEMWTKHMFDPNLCAEDNTSNFVESFNSTLGIHRTNPVLSLLEGIRRLAMVRHATRQHIADTWYDDGICPNIHTRLQKLTKNSRGCQALFSGPGEYEVKEGRTYLPVSLNKRTCRCGLWQISGIPCRHAIRAIIDSNKEPSDYVSDWFSVRRYREAYGFNISPMPDTQQWPVFDVPFLEPPTLKRSIGRPSRNRRREQGEKRKGKRSITVKCKKCNCFGHNSKTCKGGYTAKERDEMQGNIRNRRSKKGLTEDSYTSLYPSLRELERDIVRTSQATLLGSQEEATTSTSTHAQLSLVKRRKTTK
ncbi:uncharacterized protein LOC141636405 [Silene latifolia]|uniref:uncharacterized protein LOC141636405 n=1 Tax=Silene latifolia TaxID=37657 RepID=UPI003D772912